MCLAVPGKVVGITRDEDDPITGVTGTIDFGGAQVEASLAMTPDAQVGDWVLVHAGYALTIMDEQHARETWEYLQSEKMGEAPPLR